MLTAEELASALRISSRQVQRHTAAGMPHVTFHDLRRTTATLLLAHGAPLHVISKLLGHSSVSITAQRYAHLQVDEVRNALDGLFDSRKAMK